MRSTAVLSQSQDFRRLVVALVVSLSPVSSHALGCLLLNEIIQSAVQRQEPLFPAAEMVFYGRVVEVLADELASVGVVQTGGGSSLARVRVIEGFRGTTAGEELTCGRRCESAEFWPVSKC